ncbi:MAG: DNA topoisomerase 3 [Bacteroidia bacterium]|nr:DNA topoisomerase 3 [Bacteroidia bacterium]
MGKTIILAEKPSVAKELAKALSVFKRFDGYYEQDNYVVTWALGHLTELAEPAYYNPKYKRWSINDLPIIPTTLKSVILDSTKNQFKVVASLFKREDIDQLIIATDAGREGELVARSIMELANWNKETKRLWISSQTKEAILDGFNNLKESSLYDNLYEAAKARSHADWYVGLNVSRALTTKHNVSLSAGRVQTPTLAILVEREKELEKFEGSFYWTVKAIFEPFSANLSADKKTLHITKEQEKDNYLKELENKEATVTQVLNEEKVENPPLAYDLTELQRDANLYLNFSAKETLDVLQRLYENHKLVTYPRTDSRYITLDIVPTLPQRLKALEFTPFGQVANIFVEHGYRKDMDRFVKESKVTDHHAIIPTEQRVDLTKLNKKEVDLWTLIAKRFMEVLSENYLYTNTDVTLQVDKHTFTTTLKKEQQKGWRDISVLSDVVTEIGRTLPYKGEIPTVGDKFKIEKLVSRRNATEAPQRYSEATLLSAMENAGRFVDEKELKRNLSGGLGTVATRAEIIEKLINSYYVQREGRYLVPTAKGIELIRLAPEELTSPTLTAKWEGRLADISDGVEQSSLFIDDIKKETTKLVNNVKNDKSRFEMSGEGVIKCPHCDFAMLSFKDELDQIHHKCQRLGCGYEQMLVKKIKPAKQAVVKTQKLASGKKVMVVKKGKSVASYETTLKVVTPSRYKKRVEHTSYKNQEDSNTTTFADLIKASEQRRKKRS